MDRRKTAKHIVEIRNRIREAIVDLSWLKTSEDHLALARNRSLQFKPNNLMIKDPSIEYPDYGNGMMKVEPYDFIRTMELSLFQ